MISAVLVVIKRTSHTQQFQGDEELFQGKEIFPDIF